MSPREISQRAARALHIRGEVIGFGLATKPPLPTDSLAARSWISVTTDLEIADYARTAQRVIDEEFPIFGQKTGHEGSAPDWNRDPLSGIRAPLGLGKLIDHRDENSVGNIKYLWELNRHLEFLPLALAYSSTRDRTYLAPIRLRLESWLDQCPYPRGVNWASSLELGIRLINWSLTWQLAGRAESPLFVGKAGIKLRDRWLNSIYQHVHFIHHYYSQHSSANNHLIGEAAGVFVASRTWPYWRQMAQWGARARQILIGEVAAQTHGDGVNREQAIAYQQFVLDFLLLAALAGRATGNNFPANYWQTIEKMMEFLHSAMDAEGNVPMFGDADDGYVIRLSLDPDFSPVRSLLATGAILFDRPDFAAASGNLDTKSRMLVGAANWESLCRRGKVTYSTPRNAYPEGGYYIMRKNPGSSAEVRLIADAGPLGYLSIAAHGHADALSIVVSIAGREILVDPGTYAYHTKPIWREYFRGTGAHNTVRVDGLDQSVQGGNFMWLQHANASCLAFDSTDTGGLFVGEHDGYRRFPDPVTHRREVQMQSTVIEVTDRLFCRGAHEVERCWHFSEHCHVTVEGGIVVAESGPVRVTLRAAEPVREVRLLRGSEAPPAGWVSRHFDIKVPSDSIYFFSDIRGDCELRTLIQWEIRGEEHSDEG